MKGTHRVFARGSKTIANPLPQVLRVFRQATRMRAPDTID